MKVSEIFLSIEGEGLRQGELCVFIRLFGCNLSCGYCDTDYAKSGNDYCEMSVDEIVERAGSFGAKNVTITGGEPLCAECIQLLIDKLLKNGFLINIETNGSVDITKIKRQSGMFFSCDYKCPSSGMSDKMHRANFYALEKQDLLKFVVGSNEDLLFALGVIKEFKPACFVYFSPVFGKIQPSRIVEFLKEHRLFERVRIQLQLHKYIYEPNTKGV